VRENYNRQTPCRTARRPAPPCRHAPRAWLCACVCRARVSSGFRPVCLFACCKTCHTYDASDSPSTYHMSRAKQRVLVRAACAHILRNKYLRRRRTKMPQRRYNVCYFTVAHAARYLFGALVARRPRPRVCVRAPRAAAP